jgi:hypothetical protein
MIINIWNIYQVKGKAGPRRAPFFPGGCDFQIFKQHMKVDGSHLTSKAIFKEPEGQKVHN